MKETLITIGFRDRPSELGLLLTSLKNQTYNNFDILILNDCSGTPINAYHFLNCIFNLVKMEGIDIEIINSPFPYGVSRMRHECSEYGLKKGYRFIGRIDDDVILEKDFLEKLIKGLDEYDIMSGVTPPCGPTFIRDSDLIKIGNRVVLEDGKMIMNMDDFGYRFTEDKIIPSHHFRSSALMKREVLEKVKYYPTRLSKHGFREEQIFSFNAIINGFKIGNHLNAIAWHQGTMSGGERFPESEALIKFNQLILEEETKKLFEKEGNFIEKYNERLGIKLEKPTKEELSNPCNLI